MRRRAAVLTGSLGMGHHVTTDVVATSLDRLGFDTRILDCMALLGPLASRTGDWVFRRLLDVPTLYDGLHFAHFRPGGALATAVDRMATSRLVPALAGALADEPADLLVSTFATGASAAAKLASATGPDRPRPAVVVLCTDATPHRLWVRDGVDLFLVTSHTAAAAVRRYRPRAQITVVPPPVRGAFGHPPARAEARARLGIAPDARCALVMGGGWGLGPLAATATALAEQDVWVLAVAGNNRRLQRSLQAVAARHGSVTAFGFVDDIPTLMAAADVVVTTPGATTCGEARVVRRPLVLLDVVPGHGRDNIQHELALGGAEVSDAEPARCTASVLAVLDRVGAGSQDVAAAAPDPTLGPAAWEAAFAEALAVIGVSAFASPAPVRSMACGGVTPAGGSGTHDRPGGRDPAATVAGPMPIAEEAD